MCAATVVNGGIIRGARVVGMEGGPVKDAEAAPLVFIAYSLTSHVPSQDLIYHVGPLMAICSSQDTSIDVVWVY